MSASPRMKWLTSKSLRRFFKTEQTLNLFSLIFSRNIGVYLYLKFADMDYIKKYSDKFIEVQLGVLVFQEEDSYLAYCPALNLSTYGDNINDVKGAFDDLIAAYIEDGTKMGTLEKDLLSHGWTLQISA